MAEGEINIDNLIQRLLEGKRYFLIFMDFLKVNTDVIAMFSKGLVGTLLLQYSLYTQTRNVIDN